MWAPHPQVGIYGAGENGSAPAQARTFATTKSHLAGFGVPKIRLRDMIQ